MSTAAPRPPTKRLFATACVTGGTTLGMVVIVGAGHFLYGNIPTDRLVAYSLAVLIGICATGALTARYLMQTWRRDAWWDGHAASEDPSAEAVPLRRIRAELEQLTEAVVDLADAAGRPRAPSPQAQPPGGATASCGMQGDTALKTRHAELSGSEMQHVALRLADARAEGYAEGYVDGIARRSNAEGAN